MSFAMILLAESEHVVNPTPMPTFMYGVLALIFFLFIGSPRSRIAMSPTATATRPATSRPRTPTTTWGPSTRRADNGDEGSRHPSTRRGDGRNV